MFLTANIFESIYRNAFDCTNSLTSTPNSEKASNNFHQDKTEYNEMASLWR